MFKKYLDWGFIVKVLVAVIAINFALDFINTFVYAGLGEIVARPFSWARNKIMPPSAGS